MNIHPQNVVPTVTKETRSLRPQRIGWSLPPYDRRLLVRPLDGSPPPWRELDTSLSSAADYTGEEPAFPGANASPIYSPGEFD